MYNHLIRARNISVPLLLSFRFLKWHVKVILISFILLVFIRNTFDLNGIILLLILERMTIQFDNTFRIHCNGLFLHHIQGLNWHLWERIGYWWVLTSYTCCLVLLKLCRCNYLQLWYFSIGLNLWFFALLFDFRQFLFRWSECRCFSSCLALVIWSGISISTFISPAINTWFYFPVAFLEFNCLSFTL